MLVDELDQLWRVKRPQVTQAVSEAAALGDRSENAEYKEGKRELRAIDRRVRFLRKRLDVVKVVEYSTEQEGRVFFGAWVDLEDEHGEQISCRVVGSDEIDTRKHFISVNSPMARGILGKRVGDEVLIRAPEGDRYWSILGITYRTMD